MKSERKKRIIALIVIGLLMLCFMTAYEICKQLLIPDVTIWQSHFITIIFSTVCAVAISYPVLRKYDRLISKVTESRSQVSELRSLLPVCSNCKKFRDDQGYWNELVVYLENHPDIDVTHGICPQCMEELYGAEDWYKRSKKKRNKEK